MKQPMNHSNEAELLAELHYAHQIIRNALNIMQPWQQSAWAGKNAKDGVDGEGTTRANERLAVMEKAAQSHREAAPVDHAAALRDLASDMASICTLLNIEPYNGVGPVLRAILDLGTTSRQVKENDARWRFGAKHGYPLRWVQKEGTDTVVRWVTVHVDIDYPSPEAAMDAVRRVKG